MKKVKRMAFGGGAALPEIAADRKVGGRNFGPDNGDRKHKDDRNLDNGVRRNPIQPQTTVPIRPDMPIRSTTGPMPVVAGPGRMPLEQLQATQEQPQPMQTQLPAYLQQHMQTQGPGSGGAPMGAAPRIAQPAPYMAQPAPYTVQPTPYNKPGMPGGMPQPQTFPAAPMGGAAGLGGAMGAARAFKKGGAVKVKAAPVKVKATPVKAKAKPAPKKAVVRSAPATSASRRGDGIAMRGKTKGSIR